MSALAEWFPVGSGAVLILLGMALCGGACWSAVRDPGGGTSRPTLAQT